MTVTKYLLAKQYLTKFSDTFNMVINSLRMKKNHLLIALNTIALLITAVWCYSEPSYEPFTVAIALVCTLIGLIWYNKKQQNMDEKKKSQKLAKGVKSKGDIEIEDNKQMMDSSQLSTEQSLANKISAKGKVTIKGNEQHNTNNNDAD